MLLIAWVPETERGEAALRQRMASVWGMMALFTNENMRLAGPFSACRAMPAHICKLLWGMAHGMLHSTKGPLK